MSIRNNATFIAKVTEWQGRKQYTPLQTDEFGQVTTGIGSFFCPNHDIEAEVGNYVVVDSLFSVGMRQSQNLKKDTGEFGWHETSRFIVKDVAEFDNLEDAQAALDEFVNA